MNLQNIVNEYISQYFNKILYQKFGGGISLTGNSCGYTHVQDFITVILKEQQGVFLNSPCQESYDDIRALFILIGALLQLFLVFPFKAFDGHFWQCRKS